MAKNRTDLLIDVVLLLYRMIRACILECVGSGIKSNVKTQKKLDNLVFLILSYVIFIL